MYSEEMVSIGKIENGYLIQVRVPYKRDEAGCGCYPSTEEKQYHVADVAALTAKLAILLPALEDKEDASAAFKKHFAEAIDDD